MRINTSWTLCALTTVLASSGALAAPKYGRAGCGLGSMLMGPTGSQTSAATTNNSTYTQPFGISSGTSNCVVDKESANEWEQQKFITANLATVSKEMAEGRGDTLAAFAEVLGCSPESVPAVSAELKQSFRDIFLSPGALAVLDASKEHLRRSPELSKQCQWLS